LAAAGVRPDLMRPAGGRRRRWSIAQPESELAFNQLATSGARAALRDSESHDRSLLDRVPVGLYRISSQGEILNANAELVRMLGYADREALTARKASELYARPTERQFLLDRQRGEPVVRAPEVEVRRADGGSLWVEDLARPLHDATGKVVAYEGSLLDVTERRRLEAEIRASEERFRALVQNASDVIAVLDVHGEFKSLSPSVRTQLGYRPEELVGRSGFDLVHPDDLPVVRQAFGTVLRRANPGTPTEYRFRHASGAWVGVESVASNMLDQPAVGGIVLTTRVITERQQAEATRESQRLSTLLGNLPGGLPLPQRPRMDDGVGQRGRRWFPGGRRAEQPRDDYASLIIRGPGDGAVRQAGASPTGSRPPRESAGSGNRPATVSAGGVGLSPPRRPRSHNAWLRHIVKRSTTCWSTTKEGDVDVIAGYSISCARRRTCWAAR
jgi:PAS domain S-box-containing protein